MSEIGHEADRILKKYVGVWLWSILFGGNSALSYSTIALARYGEWSTMARFTFMGIIGVALICVLISYVLLLKYLSTYLLPTFFRELPSVEEEDRRLHAARMLRSAAYYTVSSIIFASLSGFLMAALSR